MSTRTYYELRAVFPDGSSKGYSHKLGITWAPIFYEGLRSAKAFCRHANAEDGDLIPRGAKIEVFRVTEEHIVEETTARKTELPPAGATEEVAA